MSTLNKVKKLIEVSHDELILAKKWDIRHRSAIFKSAYDRMYPFAFRYYFEGNPSFLNDYANFLDMERYPLIMLRDGLVNLADFFLTNFRPPSSFRSMLLIPKRMEGIVPIGWKDQVAFYQCRFPLWQGQEAPRKVLVSGLLSNYTFWKDKPETVFKDLRDKIPQESKVEFFIPLRDRLVFDSVDEAPCILESFKWLYHFFGRDTLVHSDNSRILLHKLGREDAHISLGDEPFLVADNFFDHWQASRNIPSLSAKEVAVKVGDLVYKLSPYHDIVIDAGGEAAFGDYGNLAVKLKLEGKKANAERSAFHDFIIEVTKNGLIKV